MDLAQILHRDGALPRTHILVAIARGVPKMWFSKVNIASRWQPLFCIHSLDGSTVALISCGRYFVSVALTILCYTISRRRYRLVF